MPLLATDDTAIYYWNAKTAAFEVASALPTGVAVLPTVRPTALRLNGLTLLIGQHSRMLLVDDHRQVSIAGLRGPTKAPTVAAGPGVGVTGAILARLTFRQKRGARVLQESNPGPASVEVTVANKDLVYSALPTTSPDPHATHLAGYESRDGGLYFLAWERALGYTTTLTHAVQSTFLEQQPTLPVIPGTAAHDYSARGVLPYALGGVVFNNKAWLMVPGYRGWFYGRVNELYAVSPLSFEPTRDGEMPVGLAVASDGTLLGFCRRCVYAIQDHRGAGDITVDKVSSDYGLVSPWGLVDIQGRTLFMAEQGVSEYFNGAFRNLMRDSYSDEWARLYEANPAGFETALAQNDRRKGNVKLLIPQANAPYTLYVKGRYAEMIEKNYPEPFWSKDVRSRLDTTMGEYSATGQRRAFTLVGSADGIARRDDPANTDDDGDDYGMAMTILGPADCMGDQGGDDAHGYEFPELDVFVKNDDSDLTVSLHCGDDTASAGVAQWSEPLAASALPGQVGKTSHHMTELGAAGKSGALRLGAVRPKKIEYRGHNLYYRKGEQSRPATA